MKRRGTIIKRGKRFAVVVSIADEDGRRQRHWFSGFATRKDAERGLTKILHDLDSGAYVPPDRSKVAAYFDHWIARAAVDLRPATTDSYRRVFDRYCRARIGDIKMQDLKPASLTRLYADLLSTGGRGGKGISPNTARHVHVVLHRMLKAAVREGLVVRNVAEAADQPKQRRATQEIWTSEQLRTFVLVTAADRFAALWRTYVTTGCRRGEALALRWEDVDLEDGSLEISRSLVTVNGSPVLGEPKTATGRRRIALDAETVAVLRAHKARQAAERLAAGDAYDDQGFVFCNELGASLHPNVVTRWFYRHVERAQLPRIRLHDVRHSVITAALRARVPVKVISERAGHATTAFTMDRYSHVVPDMQREAADVIAAVIDDAR